MAALNEKQERFIEEYMIDLNATQAAIRAGYSPKSANINGPRLLSNASVRARVDQRLAETSKRTGINADRVVRELARIALGDLTDIVDVAEGEIKDGVTRDDRAAISSVRVKRTTRTDKDGAEEVTIDREIKLCNKIDALELLGKHLGMFTQKLSVETRDITLEEYLRQLDAGGTDNEHPEAE